MRRRKNLRCDGLKNRRMNDDTYKLRRKVIEDIYAVNDVLRSNGKDKMPRVDVRIVDHNGRPESVLGVADIGNCTIWIPAKTLNESDIYRYNVVVHELLHAVYSIMHDDSCPLMSPFLSSPLTREEVNAVMLTYTP